LRLAELETVRIGVDRDEFRKWKETGAFIRETEWIERETGAKEMAEKVEFIKGLMAAKRRKIG